MGLFDAFKHAFKEATLDFKGWCPKCEKNTHQVQKGVLGQGTFRICLSCKAAYKKDDSNGVYYFVGYADE